MVLNDTLEAPVIEALQDIYVLQIKSEVTGPPDEGLSFVETMDNQQACIEARLQDCLQMPVFEETPLQTSILLAAYLYTYSLFTEIWHGYWIPLHVATRLLNQLRHLQRDESLWLIQERVMLWCTFIGGCLSPPGETRTGYISLLQSGFQRSDGSIVSFWPETELILDLHLWSQKHFGVRGKLFWEEGLDQGYILASLD
jgi:hypothetical protein